MFIDQRQPEHAGQRRWRGTGAEVGRGFAQPYQRIGHGIKHAVSEMTGKGVQLTTLGHQLGLLLRIACAIGIVQQGLLQRFDGQDQRRGQRLSAEADQRTQQLAHPRWQVAGGEPGFVGGGEGKDS